MARRKKDKRGTLGDVLSKAFEEGGLAVPGEKPKPKVEYGKSVGRLLRAKRDVKNKLQHWRGQSTPKPNVQPPPTSEKSAPIISEQWTPVGLQSTASVQISPEVGRAHKNQFGAQPVSKTREADANTYVRIEGTSKRDNRELIIGLDLGTSSTKVVIRDSVTKEAYLIEFPSSPFQARSHLLPTVLYCNPDGQVSLTEGKFELSGLKMCLVEKPEHVFLKGQSGVPATVGALLTAYIGLVLREARKYFLTKHRRIYEKSDIDWQLNIGIPSSGYDNSRMVNSFRAIAIAGWDVSVGTQEASIGEADAAYLMAVDEIGALDRGERVSLQRDWLHPENVKVFPEVVAEVVGYAKSDLRQEGILHLLIDIGASTVDVATFILHRDAEDKSSDKYEMMSAEVRLLGGFRLHEFRLTETAKKVEEHLRKITASCDSVNPLPDLDQYLPESISEIDEKFEEDFLQLIGDVLLHTKKVRDTMSTIWGGELPTVVAGGGASIRLYQSALANVRDNPNRLTTLRFVDAKKLSGLETNLPQSELTRIGVAYGLSFPQEEIGLINPPGSIEDMSSATNTSTWEKNYVDKDMM